MAAGRVRWLPGADPGADAEEARKRRRRSRSPLTRTAAASYISPAQRHGPGEPRRGGEVPSTKAVLNIMRGPLKDSSGRRFPRYPITPAQNRRKTLEANLKAAAPYTSDRLR